MRITTRKRELRAAQAEAAALQDLTELLAEQVRKGVRSPEEARDVLLRELRARPQVTRLRERIARWIMP